MKIDQQYLRDLLIAFEDNPGPQTNISELNQSGFVTDDKLIFHMRLLDDQHLIQRTDGERGFGYYESADGYGTFDSLLPLRLTARGHDFIGSLRQKEVWNSVKTSFKDESISSLVEISKHLAKGFAMKKIKDLTGFDPD